MKIRIWNIVYFYFYTLYMCCYSLSGLSKESRQCIDLNLCWVLVSREYLELKHNSEAWGSCCGL